MEKPEFVYVTYIATTPAKLWKALIDGRTTKKYWQHENISDWKPGSPWEHREFDRQRTLKLVGKVVEFKPPKRLVLTWADPADRDREEKHSRVTIELKPMRGVVRLTVIHDRLERDPGMLQGISEGWPIVLSSLKSLLEKGKPLPKLW